jgi:hypothetical protein
MGWDAFLSGLTARLWVLRAVSIKLDDKAAPRATIAIACPPDKDVANALALAGALPGRYKITAKCRQRGEQFEKERRRIRMERYDRPPTGFVVVEPAQAAAPRDPRMASGGVSAANAAADVEVAKARADEARADAAAARARIKKLEGSAPSDLGQLLEYFRERDEKPAQNTGGDVAGVLQLMLTMQQQANTQQLALFQSMLKESQQREQQALRLLASSSRAASPAAAGLAAVVEQLELVEQLKERFSKGGKGGGDEDDGDGDDDKDGELVGLVRELRLMFTKKGPEPAPPPTEVHVHNGATNGAPAPAPAPQVVNVATTRVREFLSAVIAEAANGSDPEAIAELLEQKVALLPAMVRRHLDAGQWRPALDAIRAYLEPVERAELDLLTSNAEASAWCEAFARGCALEPETTP